MAESAVKSTANWLGKLLVEEGKYLWGVEDKVAQLRKELVWMQCFLRDADSLQYDDEIVAQWVLEIKEYVYEAEDIVDKFVIQVASIRRQSGWMNKLKRWSHIGMELFAMHQVASSIDSLIHKISMLTPRLQTYGLKTAYGMKTYRTRETLSDQTQERMSYVHLDAKNIVGLEQDTEIIVKALLDSKEKRRVVSIYGMGGLGKTTLATKVYNDVRIKEHFTGGCAWAYISKQFQVQNVLQILLADLTSKSTDLMAGKVSKELICELREFLQKKRCLVVLDDVWEREVWDFLSDAFPQIAESGSKVLLTTRKEEVAKHADPEALPKPDLLNADVSWKLLQQTLGWGAGSSGEESVGENNNVAETIESSAEENVQTNVAGMHKLLEEMFGSSGNEVIELGKAMVKHCNGIPLAIVVLGGILRKKETVEEWRLVRENITSYLRRGNDHGRSYMEVLVLSYNDLPYHLKPCFLHLGNFPEDHEIHAEKLYRMWVAEGLVTWPRDRVLGTESLEDIANDYLSDLAHSGMVQIMNKGSKGRIKSFRIHDLMRDVCLQKAVAENFLSVIDYRPCPDEPQTIFSTSNHERLIRMAVYLAQDVKNYLPDSLTSTAHKYLRSLLFFAGRDVHEGGNTQWIKGIFNNFPWIRVLDMEGLCLKGRLTKDVHKVIHLRYLSLKDTDISELPSSISKLRCLQTLDLRVSFSGSSVKIPNTLWKLARLRHLFLPKKPYEIKKREYLRLDTLCCLETLKNLEIGKSRIEDLQELRKLKKLSIKDIVCDVERIRIIVESPALKSGNLRSCSLGIKGSAVDRDPNILSSFNCLDQLNVMDKISTLKDNIFPRFLKVLHLESCELDNDPMGILGSLRHLKELSLGSNSFIGKRMTCLDQGFPQLTILNLRGLVSLEVWMLKIGSMPKLKKLIIMNCGKLKSIPENLPSSIMITCSPCINGIEKYGTCICYRGTFFGVFDYEGDFIGLPEETGKGLVDLLSKNKEVVLSGTCGVSRETLANMLYQQQETRGVFDAIAWARYPHRQADNSLHRHFILGLLKQLPTESSDKLSSQRSSNTLIKELQKVVQEKKCLIILTDVTESPQDCRMIFGCDLPEAKLLFITHEQPTSDSNELVTHKLSPLSDVEIYTLFQKRLGGALSGNDGTIKNELGKSMLKHFSNHPLSVIMLAGLLAMKQTFMEWQSIQKELTLRMEKAQGPESMYALSYDDLPPHLKYCFLYLAIFPKDMEIPARKLYRMWIAAGFVRLKDDEAEAVELLENIVESYLNELVRRGMVQVGKRGPNGRISTCWVHVVLHGLCSAKEREEHFVTILDQVEPSASSGERLNTEHLGVHFNQGEANIIENMKSRTDQLKSLVFFPKSSESDSGEENWGWFIRLCNNFRFLRVLDLEGMWMTKGMLPTEVGNVNQLRYLSLRGTWVSELPPAIQQLSKLQILDLRVMESLFIPDVLFSFPQLRHLHLPNSFAPRSPKLQLHGLDHLRTLGNLNTEKVDLDCLAELKNLRKISIRNIHAEKDLDEKLKSISTHIDLSISSEVLEGNPTILSSFQNLHKATIKGEISVPLSAAMFPECLKELTLKHSKLKHDPVTVLGKLPGLTRLTLDHNAYMGKKMTFAKGGFPRLTHLKLRLLSNLEELDMTEAEHLSSLQSLEYKDCWRLEIKEFKFAAAETRVGPLQNHPLLGLLRQKYRRRGRP